MVLVAPTVSVDDNIMKVHFVHFQSHGKGEHGGEEIGQGEQNRDKQQERRDNEREGGTHS